MPDVRDAIAKVMGKKINMWLANVDGNDNVYPPAVILPQLFRRCLEEVMVCRQGIVDVFLGKVAGATEEAMDPVEAKDMLHHMRRYHKTLFPLTRGTRELDNVLSRVFCGISDHIRETFAIPTPPVEWLHQTGLAKVAFCYLEIIVDVVLQPHAKFGDDNGHLVQNGPHGRQNAHNMLLHSFDQTRHHSLPIDASLFVTGAQYIVVFPALLESGGEVWTKSYLLPVGDESIFVPRQQPSGTKNSSLCSCCGAKYSRAR